MIYAIYFQGIHVDDFRDVLTTLQEDMHLQCDFHAVLNKIAHFTTIQGDYISLLSRYRQNTSKIFFR